MIELIELSLKSRLMAEIEDIKKLREGVGGGGCNGEEEAETSR